MKALVTGAGGWIGQALCRELVARGHSVHALTARADLSIPGAALWVHTLPNFEGIERDWPADFAPDAVFHLAGRAHQMPDLAPDPAAAYQATNCIGTGRIARAALEHGARQLIFLSSIKALGDIEPGRPWYEDDAPGVLDAYGQSKHDAEELLKGLRPLGLASTIVRIPLVYGPGVGANFLQLVRLVDRGWPLPLGRATAERSFIALSNVVDALVACASDERAQNQTFHVADAAPVSVRALIAAIAVALGRHVRLVAVPIWLLRALGFLTGSGDQIDRLTRPLRLECARIHELLGWTPGASMQSALAETVISLRVHL